MTPEAAGSAALADPTDVDLIHAVDCIRAAARFDGHDMFWALPQGPLHDTCLALERHGLVDRHDDVASQFVGWRPR